jgi:hypothetical protein
VFEVSLADLQGDEDNAFRKIRLRAEDVQGKNLLTNFWVCFWLCLWLCIFPISFTLCLLLLCSLFYRVWILPLTSLGHWCENGKLWLKLMLMLRPLIIILWECSALGLPRDVATRLRGHAMLNPARSNRYIYYNHVIQHAAF